MPHAACSPANDDLPASSSGSLAPSDVDSTDRLVSLCVETARKEGVAAPGDTVVITAGVPLSSRGTTNLIKAQVVGE